MNRCTICKTGFTTSLWKRWLGEDLLCKYCEQFMSNYEI